MKPAELEYVAELDRVTVLLHPLRLQIMELAIEGTSATEAARRLGLPRQMVHYHVLALEKASFLVRAGEIKKRNMVERRLQATARSYVIAPDVLGALSAARRRVHDPSSHLALLGLAARMQSEVAAAAELAFPAPPSTLVLSSKIRFSDSTQRDDFVHALGEAVARLIREYSIPSNSGDRGEPPHTLILGLYSLPGRSPPQPASLPADATPDG
jgi:DNA-binding transcriptional ArsR family regulator